MALVEHWEPGHEEGLEEDLAGDLVVLQLLEHLAVDRAGVLVVPQMVEYWLLLLLVEDRWVAAVDRSALAEFRLLKQSVGVVHWDAVAELRSVLVERSFLQ